MLGDSIALIIGASYFGVEASRATSRLARWVLAALCLCFIAAAILLKDITAAYPKVGKFISEIFDDPSAWFILLVGLFFILRPFWSIKEASSSNRSNALLESGEDRNVHVIPPPYDDTKLRAEIAEKVKWYDDAVAGIPGIRSHLSDQISQVRLEDASRVMGPMLDKAIKDIGEALERWEGRVNSVRDSCKAGERPHTMGWQGDQPLRSIASDCGLEFPNDHVITQPVDTYGMDDDKLRGQYIQFATALQIGKVRAGQIKLRLEQMRNYCNGLVHNADKSMMAEVAERAKG